LNQQGKSVITAQYEESAQLKTFVITVGELMVIEKTVQK